MGFVFGLLLGLLVGWIVELIIDWRFWRLDGDSISNRLNAGIGNLVGDGGNNDALNAQLSEAKAEIDRLQAALAAAATGEVKREDRLERINGVGKVFRTRFNEAGIYTFAEVAALTPERITEIMGVTESWRKIDPESWIAEAAQFASGAKQ